MNCNSEEKLDPVRRYLSAQFPSHVIRNECRSASRDEIFTVEHGTALYKARFTHLFLEDHTPGEIAELLRAWDLANALCDAGEAVVMVTSSGIPRA